MARTLYSGDIAVAASDHRESVLRDGDCVKVDIEGLDALVTRRTHLGFTLDYPFERSYEGRVIGDGGITLRQIIDAVRHGFRIMYRAASHAPIPNMHNQIVDGDYGRAFHAIEDLAIESIHLDDESGVLEIGIGS